MNYNLNQLSDKQEKASILSGVRSLLALITDEKKAITWALVLILLNTLLSLSVPVLAAYAIDHYFPAKDFHGVLVVAGIILLLDIGNMLTRYYETTAMGGVGQRMLFTLRNAIFNKLQLLPVAFFNSNKAGDLISRVNNDTDKLNSFFSQSLIQFVGSIATTVVAGIFLVSINWKLGLIALSPAVLIFIFTRIVSPWVKSRNARSLKTTGALSAEIQESLDNFRVIVAFNRRDYFRRRFDQVNKQNYKNSLSAGIANNVFSPVYTLLAGLAQLMVVLYGIHLIGIGELSIGLLVSYIAYTLYFYDPLRQLSTLWANFQVAIAGWDRVSQILKMESDLVQMPATSQKDSDSLIEFRNVSFGYEEGKEILHNISLELQRGKTYAFVGPTGGGKTTTVSLMARLYDPNSGAIYLDGKDIRTYTPEQRTDKIGFILQEPFLFTGTLRDNILYGNSKYKDYTDEQLEELIRKFELQSLLEIFDEGLKAPITSGSGSISLGQKQLIAFMRAVLREPEVLILDEATANIDTVTEKLLQEILDKLPSQTTRIIIAHRLNTIENADEIYFVNSGEVLKAGSFEDALDKLMQGKRAS